MLAVKQSSVSMLGSGVYSLSEISCYTSLPATTVRSWFKSRSDGSGLGPVFQSDYQAVGMHYAISFLDMIDALIAGQFRRSGVRMSVVRRAYAKLQEELKSPHPFCHADLHTDGKRIIARTAASLNDSLLHDVISKQQFFDHVFEYLHHIDYEEASQLARRWRIAEGVVLDPQLNFGKPVVQGTGISTRVLANQYSANCRDSELVASLFEITESQVLNAVRFESTLQKHEAA